MMKEFKQYVSDIDVGDILKTPSLAIFSFHAVLNIAMLITESERAKAIRSKMLNFWAWFGSRDKTRLKKYYKMTYFARQLRFLVSIKSINLFL